MSKDITAKMPKSKKEYRQQKANCNLYERTWRKNHPKEHKKNSKELLSTIRKQKPSSKPKQAVRKKRSQPTTEPEEVE